jgi:hypothetical protein
MTVLYRHEPPSISNIHHKLFSLSTFVSFNCLFFLGVRPTIGWMSPMIQHCVSWLAVLVSTLWCYRVSKQNVEYYNQRSVASSLRRQLKKLPLDLTPMLGDLTIDKMTPNDLDLLAKILPTFSHQYQLQIYQGVLQEAIAEGHMNSSSNLEMLQQLRQKLNITHQDHTNILAELGIHTDRLNPDAQRKTENTARLSRYQQALELMVLELLESGIPLKEALRFKHPQISALQQEYEITATEKNQILKDLLHNNHTMLHRAEILLNQLNSLISVERQIGVQSSITNANNPLNSRAFSVHTQKQMIITKLLRILEILGEDAKAIQIASQMERLARPSISDVLMRSDQYSNWHDRISPRILTILQ